MKVLISIKCIECPGGVANFYRILELGRRDDMEYFSPKIHKNKFLKPFWFFISYILYFTKIKEYDIIHVNPSLGNTATWRDLFFVMIGKLRRKKVVVFFHGWEYEFENKIKTNILLKNLFHFYNGVNAFFVSGTVFKKELISMGISPVKKFYLETMIADDRYIEDFSLEKRIEKFNNEAMPIKFLFISRITKGKGMQLAINIFNIVQLNHKQKMELIIAGDGDKLEETKQYVQKNGIKNVRFTGYVKDRKKHNLLKDCDITLFPTMYGEGIPNTVLEGMLYGMPIISRVNAGIPDWVINNVNGFISESTKAKDFVPFIDKIINDKSLFEKIARNNFKKAKGNFTKEVITKRFLEHYMEIYNTS